MLDPVTIKDDTNLENRIVGGSHLLRAETYRLLSTPFMRLMLLIAIIPALFLGLIRAMTGQDFESIGASGIDILSFFAALAGALLISRDYQSGSMELRLLIEPSRAKLVLMTGMLIAAVFASAAAVLILTVSAFAAFYNGSLDPFILRSFASYGISLVAVIMSTLLGVGIGYLSRSNALSTFAITVIFWVAPLALLIASLSGATWIGSAYEYTVGMLVSLSIDSSSYGIGENLLSLLFLGVWSMLSLLFGTLRAMRN